jgi:GNAT superfamily N-acetyltransferase
LLIAILKHKRKKLYIDLKPLEKKFLEAKNLEFQISAYQREEGKRKLTVGHLEYTVRIANKNKTGIPCEIYIDNIDVIRSLRNKGYGRIIIGFAQAIAQASELKLILFSFGDVVGFYKKCGFHSVIPESQDMVWYPKKRKKKHGKIKKI